MLMKPLNACLALTTFYGCDSVHRFLSFLPPLFPPGPPGCGKSTLLKLLCGRLDADKLPAGGDDDASDDDDDDDDVDYNRPVDVENPEGGAGTTQQRPQAGKKKTRKVPQGGVRFSGDICYNKRPLRDIVPSR